MLDIQEYSVAELLIFFPSAEYFYPKRKTAFWSNCLEGKEPFPQAKWRIFSYKKAQVHEAYPDFQS